MTDTKIDTKHFLMAIVAIVAIVAISFLAVMMTNDNQIPITGGAYAGVGSLSDCLGHYGATANGVETCLGGNFIEVYSENCHAYKSLDGSVQVISNCN